MYRSFTVNITVQSCILTFYIEIINCHIGLTVFSCKIRIVYLVEITVKCKQCIVLCKIVIIGHGNNDSFLVHIQNSLLQSG